MIRCIYFSIFALVRNSLVEESQVSGFAVPVHFGGDVSWFGLDFTATKSTVWPRNACPYGVSCVASNTDRDVIVGGFDKRYMSFGSLEMSTTDVARFTDVAGKLAVGPNGDYTRNGVFTYRRRGENVSLHSDVLSGNPELFALKRGSDLWEFQGALGHPRHPRLLGAISEKERIIVDLSEKDIILPYRLRSAFLTQGILTGVSGRTDTTGRLYLPTPFGSSGRRDPALSLRVSTGDGVFEVPVLWTRGCRIQNGFFGVNPLTVRFVRDSPIVIGSSLLMRYDVSLDARNRIMGLEPKTVVVGDLVRNPNPPRRALIGRLDIRFISDDATTLMWNTGIIEHQMEHAMYQLLSVDSLGFTVIPITRDTPAPSMPQELRWNPHARVSIAPVPRGSNPDFTRVAKLDPNGQFEFAVDRTGGVVRVGLRAPTGEPRADMRSDDCPICLETLENGKLRELPRCGHLFHKNCIDQWIVRNRQCAKCRMPL